MSYTVEAPVGKRCNGFIVFRGSDERMTVSGPSARASFVCCLPMNHGIEDNGSHSAILAKMHEWKPGPPERANPQVVVRWFDAP